MGFYPFTHYGINSTRAIHLGTFLVACLSISAGFPDFSTERDGGLNFTTEAAHDYQKISL
jgi:hypothetical protein